MGNLRYLTPGERLAGYPADAHNAFFDTYKRVHQQGGPSNGTGQTSSVPTVTCLVENSTGADITADFPILKLTGTVFDYDDSEQAIYRGVAFTGGTPAADTDIGNVAVVQGPIANGAMRAAVLLGPTWCQVNVSDAAHTFAKPKASSAELASDAASGARIIWKQTGTGTKWALVLLGGGGSAEKLRLVRGQSVGAQSGATILLDNVVVLAGGLDPSDGNPATQVRAANIFSQSYADNEWVDIVYSPGVSASPAADWETLKAAVGTETYRAIRGQTTANVTANASTFTIDNIELLAGSLDPRATPGSTTETLTIHKEDVKTALRNNDWITAVYNDTDDQWELLLTERFRAIRGTWYSGTSTLVIDHIVVLDNGLDPRSDPTSDTETVNVTNVTSTDTYSSGDKVWADWNAKDGVWEARPKAASGGSTAITKARVTTAISAATDAETWGSGQVELQSTTDGALSGTPIDVDNEWIGMEWPVDAQVAVDTSFDPPRVLTGTCEAVTWE